MVYKDYGAFAKNTADGYIYVLQQFANTPNKCYGIHFYKDPNELWCVFDMDYNMAKTITEQEAF